MKKLLCCLALVSAFNSNTVLANNVTFADAVMGVPDYSLKDCLNNANSQVNYVYANQGKIEILTL